MLAAPLVRHLCSWCVYDMRRHDQTPRLEVLRTLAQARGLTIAQLCKRANVSRSSLYRTAAERTTWTDEALERLAKTLGTNAKIVRLALYELR